MRLFFDFIMEKKKRFKVGEVVTYKDNNILSYDSDYVDHKTNKKYYYRGENQAGFRGVIKGYNSYKHKTNCYEIIVSTMNINNYTMLESEFEEYDIKEYPKEVENFLEFKD